MAGHQSATKARLALAALAVAAFAAACGGDEAATDSGPGSSSDENTAASTDENTAAEQAGSDESSTEATEDELIEQQQEAADAAGIVFEVGLSTDTVLNLDDGRTIEFESLECEVYQDDFEATYSLSGTRSGVYSRLPFATEEEAYVTVTMATETTFVGLTQLVSTTNDGLAWSMEGMFSIIEDGATSDVGGTLTSTCVPD